VSWQIDLSGCRAKLDRAWAHRKTLDREIKTHIDRRAYGVVGYLNPKTGRKQIDFEILEPNPPIWGVIVGDFCHNLRSALDHLVYELSGHRRMTQFPIFTSIDDYLVPDDCGRIKRDQLLRGVPERDRAIIDGYQPYQRGAENASHDPLAILSSLNNADKHRVINSSVAHMSRFEELDIEFPDGDVEGFRAEPLYKLGTPLKHGTPLWEVTLWPDPGAQMDVRNVMPLRVAFGQPLEDTGGLTRIHKYVANLVERFG
jgi:hypothetical protein